MKQYVVIVPDWGSDGVASYHDALIEAIEAAKVLNNTKRPKGVQVYRTTHYKFMGWSIERNVKVWEA